MLTTIFPKKSRINLVLACVLFISLNTVSLKAQIDYTLIGAWSGELIQSGFGSYPAIMIIDEMVEGEVGGKINYYDLPCSGDLTFEGVSSTIQIFRETITGGAGCVNNGRIEIEKINDDTIQWNWFYNGGTTVATSGKMARMQIDYSLVNDWCGEVFQINYGTYEMNMRIDSLNINTLSGETVYPTLNCGGDDTFYGSLGDVHIFYEEITFGGNCIDGRIEVYKIGEDSLQMDWYYPGGNQPITYGVLGRKNTSQSNLIDLGEKRAEVSLVSPNPFTNSTQFNIKVSHPENVEVELYDLLGVKVKNIYSGFIYPNSTKTFNILGEEIPAGNYILIVRGDRFLESRRVVRM
ncbi:MAG: T9SS type A sorting domain-containing protein [Saprospiraceae bacterium]